MKAKKAKDDVWVKIRILKHIISVYGSYFPGVAAIVPKRIATNWAENGIAELTDPDPEAEAEVEAVVEAEETPDAPAVVAEEDPISDPVEVEAEVEVAEAVAEVVKPKRTKRVRKSRKKE